MEYLGGFDKLLEVEGGDVVLTLKDQSILADGDINEEVDMLENVEIGEQNRRDKAYKASKKNVGVYYDKFNDDLGVHKKMLPQYDDPVADEGLTLDSSGRFSEEAERKLGELRKRIQGVSSGCHGEDLNSMCSTDYYTQEEMIKFKKHKKRKSSRKEKLDINALEAEAIASGLGVEDLGSRNDGRRQNLKKEHDRIEAAMRSNAYQSALAKADEASKALRHKQRHTMLTSNADKKKPDSEDETLIEWGGGNMDKKKSKFVGIVGGDAAKEIRIERSNDSTPKEAFRTLSHKFHGNGPGKVKQEKRVRQSMEELKIKKMKKADMP